MVNFSEEGMKYGGDKNINDFTHDPFLGIGFSNDEEIFLKEIKSRIEILLSKKESKVLEEEEIIELEDLKKQFKENISEESSLQKKTSKENPEKLLKEVMNYPKWIKWEEENSKKIPYSEYIKLQEINKRIIKLNKISKKTDEEVIELKELETAVKLITISNAKEYSTFEKIYSFYGGVQNYCIKTGKDWFDWLSEAKDNISYFRDKEKKD